MLAFFFRVDRNLLAMMAPAPAAMIQGLTHGDAIEPRFQRTAAAEIANPAKRAEKNFLGNVSGVGAIGQNSVNEVVHTGVVVGDEPIERGLRTSLQFGDQFGLITSPRQRLCEVGHAVRRHPPGCAHKKLDTGAPCSVTSLAQNNGEGMGRRYWAGLSGLR